MDPIDQGYDDKRFQNVVDANFHCPICMNVLKDPVQCRRNEHYYCTPCIMRHLEQNSQTCPMCMEVLTVETLREPSRIVSNCLSPLKINCDYRSRGCGEIVELGVLKTHVKNCEFSPVPCSIDGCLVTINKRDKLHHETNVCGFRKVKCDDCDKEILQKEYKTHGCVLKREMEAIKMNQAEIKDQLKELTRKTDQTMRVQEEMMKEMRDMMAEMRGGKKKLATQATVGLPRGDIIVAGGHDGTSHLNSAERFSWSTRAWVPLPPMKQPRSAPSSFVYENQIIVNGGFTGSSGTDTMERIDMDQEPKQWLDFPAKLPFKCTGHTSVIYQDRLIIVGGYNRNEGKTSDGIYEVLITPPYKSKLVCRMAQPRQDHGAVLFNDKILIVGGTTTGYNKDSVDSVLLYDVNEHNCKEIAPLPFEVSYMASVCHGDSLVMMGGWDKAGNALGKVVMYNIETGKCQMLPNMNVKRDGCVAVVTGNVIVVMGGRNKEHKSLNSAESFSFDRQVWEELPPMVTCRQMSSCCVVKPLTVSLFSETFCLKYRVVPENIYTLPTEGNLPGTPLPPGFS